MVLCLTMRIFHSPFSPISRTNSILDLKVSLLATFRLKCEDNYEYKFSVLDTCFRFEGRKFLKCMCSERKTRTGSCPCTPV